MENTQRIWILYVIVLSLNYLTAEEGAAAAKRHFIINVSELVYILKMSWLQNYFAEEGLLLFPQEMRGCGFIMG